MMTDRKRHRQKKVNIGYLNWRKKLFQDRLAAGTRQERRRRKFAAAKIAEKARRHKKHSKPIPSPLKDWLSRKGWKNG